MESSLRAGTLRTRLAKFIPLVLRLVSLIISSLPNSRQARDLGAAFLEAHHVALLRVLRESVSPAIRYNLGSLKMFSFKAMPERASRSIRNFNVIILPKEIIPYIDISFERLLEEYPVGHLLPL